MAVPTEEDFQIRMYVSRQKTMQRSLSFIINNYLGGGEMSLFLSSTDMIIVIIITYGWHDFTCYDSEL